MGKSIVVFPLSFPNSPVWYIISYWMDNICLSYNRIAWRNNTLSSPGITRKNDSNNFKLTAYNRAYLASCLRHSAQISLRGISDTLEPLYDILPASKGISFEGFSWQRENFLDTRMYISIMIHKEVGTWQTKE